MNILTKTSKILTKIIHYNFASYYKMVTMFDQVQHINGSKNKIAHIRNYKNNLDDQDKKEFDSLIDWHSKKESVRITLKVINKYYLAQYQSAINHATVEPQLAEGGVMRKLCKNDVESQLTIKDINIFLTFLCDLKGTGAQKLKAQKIVQLGKNVSIIQGIFLLKLIQRKLTIGVGNKTFKKADLQEEQVIEQQKQKKQKPKQKPRKKKVKKEPQQENMT